jgi:hypothetical protein
LLDGFFALLLGIGLFAVIRSLWQHRGPTDRPAAAGTRESALLLFYFLIPPIALLGASPFSAATLTASKQTSDHASSVAGPQPCPANGVIGPSRLAKYAGQLRAGPMVPWLTKVSLPDIETAPCVTEWCGHP